MRARVRDATPADQMKRRALSMHISVIRDGQSRHGPGHGMDKAGSSEVVVSILDGDVWRVRLSSRTFKAGSYMGTPMTTQVQTFLDVTTSTVTAGTYSESDSMASVIPANSKDVLDLGRLDAAMNELLQQMASIEEPSIEQIQAWAVGYTNVTGWLNAAHRRLAAADEVARMLALHLRKHL